MRCKIMLERLWSLCSSNTFSFCGGLYMSPKKKGKLKHQTHEGGNYIPRKVSKGQDRRGIKKFMINTIDVEHVLDWEADNYEEVYN